MDELLDQVLFEFGVEYGANNPNESLYQQEQSSAKDQMTPLASFPTYEIDPLEPLHWVLIQSYATFSTTI